MTGDAIKEHFPSRQKVSFALDRWTSTKNISSMLVIAYDMDQNWALGEVRLTVDYVDPVIVSTFES
jgi:hypothetical protein